MTVTCVVTNHNNRDQLTQFLEHLQLQTQQPDEVIILASDIEPIDHPNFYLCPNRNDAGHEKRDIGLYLSQSNYTCFMNTDDEYDSTFIEKLSSRKADLMYCNFDSHLAGHCKSELQIGKITSGNFMVRTGIAKIVGWKHRNYQADWYFIRDLLTHDITSIHIDEFLYTHK